MADEEADEEAVEESHSVDVHASHHAFKRACRASARLCGLPPRGAVAPNMTLFLLQKLRNRLEVWTVQR